MTTEKMIEDTYLIDDRGVGIDRCDDMYNFHLWGKGLCMWMVMDEMEEFLEAMTDDANQKKMKDELIKIKLQNEVERMIKNDCQP